MPTLKCHAAEAATPARSEYIITIGLNGLALFCRAGRDYGVGQPDHSPHDEVTIMRCRPALLSLLALVSLRAGPTAGPARRETGRPGSVHGRPGAGTDWAR